MNDFNQKVTTFQIAYKRARSKGHTNFRSFNHINLQCKRKVTNIYQFAEQVRKGYEGVNIERCF